MWPTSRPQSNAISETRLAGSSRRARARGRTRRAAARGEFSLPIAVHGRTCERRDQPLIHVPVQMKQEVADAVARLVGAPPHLIGRQRLDAAPHTRPVFVGELMARGFEKESGECLLFN